MEQQLFTQNEKIAITDIIMQMMSADGKIDMGELAYMLQLRVVLGITDADIEKAKEQDIFTSAQAIRNMTDEKKDYLTLILREMMNADGKMGIEEQKLFILMAKLCNFPIAKNDDAQSRTLFLFLPSVRGC